MKMFKTYEQLPKRVEAAQFTDKTKDRIFNELTGNTAADHEDGKPILEVTTIHGEIATVRLGDWIVKDVKPGTYYPVKDEVFRARFIDGGFEMVENDSCEDSDQIPEIVREATKKLITGYSYGDYTADTNRICGSV